MFLKNLKNERKLSVKNCAGHPLPPRSSAHVVVRQILANGFDVFMLFGIANFYCSNSNSEASKVGTRENLGVST